MLKCLECMDVKKVGIFVGGVLFGTAGMKVLASKDAKKVYVNCVAAGLRAKDCIMDTVTAIQECADDIFAEAEEINRLREEEEFFETDEEEVFETEEDKE